NRAARGAVIRTAQWHALIAALVRYAASATGSSVRASSAVFDHAATTITNGAAGCTHIGAGLRRTHRRRRRTIVTDARPQIKEHKGQHLFLGRHWTVVAITGESRAIAVTDLIHMKRAVDHASAGILWCCMDRCIERILLNRAVSDVSGAVFDGMNPASGLTF